MQDENGRHLNHSNIKNKLARSIQTQTQRKISSPTLIRFGVISMIPYTPVQNRGCFADRRPAVAWERPIFRSSAAVLLLH
jgi:hypothetical protein